MPEDQIEELAEHSANTIPVMMPYIDAFFMPRAMGDRPDIVPEGAVNFAFLGQFAETGRDTIFTTEYSMRTGMEAVYTLLDIDRGVPEVWGSTYDVRALIDATVKLRDGKKITDMDLPLIPRLAMKEALKRSRVPTLRNSSRNTMRFELVALIHFESPLKTARFCSQRLAADAGCFAPKRNNVAQKCDLVP